MRSGTPVPAHAFLSTLEATGCVGDRAPAGCPRTSSGDERWAARRGGARCTLKAHSWGEFVFDWSWAQAYRAAGLRLLPEAARAPCRSRRSPGRVCWFAMSSTAMSPPPAPLLATTSARSRGRQRSLRRARQLHEADDQRGARGPAGSCGARTAVSLWRNRGYRDFDDFLDGFRADKRKKVRRERRRVPRPASSFRTLHGDEIDAALWRTVFCVLRAHVSRARQRATISTRILHASLARRCPARSS